MPTALRLLLMGLVAFGGCQKSTDKPESSHAASPPSPCDGVDEADLSQVMACFYAPGPFDWKRTWRFTSADTRAEVTEADWGPQLIPEGRVSLDGTFSGGPCVEVAATLLSNTDGRARVERVRRCKRQKPVHCKLTQTDTWIREEAGWRRLVLPATARAVGDHWNQGRYAELQTAAAAWAARQPDSVNALRLLGWSMMRGVGAPRPETLRAHIQRMRSLNPNDSEVRLIAASIAPTLAEARTVLDSFSAGECFGPLVAANTSLRAQDPAERMAIIEGSAFSDDLAMTRLETLYELKRHDEARAVLASDALTAQLDTMKSQDPAFRAGWGLRMGEIAAALGEHELARPWLRLALDLPDTAPRARELLER